VSDPEASDPGASDTETGADAGVDVSAPAEPDTAAGTAPGGADEPVGATGASVGTFVVLEVTNVTFSLPSPSPVVQLREHEPPYRGMEFPVGLVEAQAIALALEGERAPRPSTHELLSAVVVASGSDVIALRLTGERGGTLLAELDLMTPRGREVLDCRPSDGIAVALRQDVRAPVLCEESLLDR